MATKTASTAAVTLQGSCQLGKGCKWLQGRRSVGGGGGGGQTGEITVVARTKTAIGLGLAWLWLQWSEWNEDWRNATGIAGCIMIMPNVPATCPMSV